MQKKMKKPFAMFLVLLLLVTTVCNDKLFALAEGSETPETLVVTEAHNETEENSDVPESESVEESITEFSETNSDETETPAEEWITYEPVSQPSGVRVKAYAKAGILPEGAVMKVTALEEGSAEHDAAEQVLNESSVAYDGFKAIDISFYDGAGNLIEPQDGAVQVCIEMDASMLPEEADTSSLAVQHLDESTGKVDVQTVAEAAVGTVETDESAVTAEFSVESFSTFTLTWNNNHNTLEILCVDEVGNEIGENKNATINESTSVSEIAPQFKGYEFLRSTVGNIEIKQIRCKNNKWQYSASDVGRNWTNIKDNTVKFIYRVLGPTVNITQSVSGDTVTLTASTMNFTSTPTLTWSISGTTDAVDYDPVNHTVTWKENAVEGAEVTVTVDAVGTNDEKASTSITLKNEFVTITYDPNTSRGGNGTQQQVKDRVGATITVPGNDFNFTNSNDGRTFGGWGTKTYTDSSETNKVYTPGQMITITGDMFLYAQWVDSNATVSHMDIRIEGVTFTRVVEIVDGDGKVINRATQTFTGKVTGVQSAKIEGYDGFTHDYNDGPYSSNTYEFRLGSFPRQNLSNIKSVTAVVTITGDDGTVLTNQTVTFTKEQINAAWANCGSGGTGKGMDFNISSANIELEVQKIPAKLIVTKDFVGLDNNLVSQLNDFAIDVNGQKLTINDPVQRTVTIGGQEVTIVKALESDGSYMWALTNLPADSYTVVESGGEKVNDFELHKSTYVARDYNSNNSTNSGTGKETTVTLGSEDIKVVEFTNTYGKQLANLTIQKVVNGATVPEETQFTFDVYKSNADLTKDTPVGTIVLPTENDNMTDSIPLEVDDYIIVERGGEIANYNHTSTVYVGNEGVTDNGNASATIKLPVNGIQVTCTNTYEKAVNDLIITKAVATEGNDAIDVSNITFSFKVKGANDLSGTYDIVKPDESSGTVTFTNGEATVDLQGTGSVTIKNLPVGLYNVEEIKPETDPEGYYFDESQTTQSGSDTLTKDHTGSVTITNNYLHTRTVTIKKIVDGSMGNKNQKFEFSVTVNGQSVSDEIKLAHEETYELTGLKIDDVVVVTETDYSSDGYITTIGENTTNSCTVTVKQNEEVVVTNTKNVSAPTGIFRNIFPFIMMIVIAVDAAIVFFIMYMRRRRY